MNTLLCQIDSSWVLALAVPLGIVVTAWLLRISCGMCGVKVPDFWHAVLAILFLGIVHVVLRFWMKVSDVPLGIGSQIIVPLAATALAMAICLRTGPLAALRIALVQSALCGVMYFGVVLVGMLTNGVHMF